LDPIPYLAALLSALAHAAWNAAARNRPNPNSAVTATVTMAGVISLPFVAFCGLPPFVALPWLLLGVIFNSLTLRILVASYRFMPFGVAYPLMRGTIPLAVTALSLILGLGSSTSTFALLGIISVSIAVTTIAFSGRRVEHIAWKPLILSIVGGVSAALYVLTDVKGIEATGDPIIYGLAAAVVNAVALPLYQRFEGQSLTGLFRGNVVFGLFASCVSMGSYVLFLFALTHGPVGAASAIRETSVLFALAFSLFALKEPVGVVRWIACLLAVLGNILIRMA
jgi:drug/metabolite transporter (DMT)-like permease